MKYKKIKNLDGGKFRRLTGVKPSIFNRMVIIIKEAHAKKKAKGGRNNKLIIEDMILMTLEYWREYRTYFHVGQSYGVSESSAYKTIKWVTKDQFKEEGNEIIHSSGIDVSNWSNQE